MENLGTKVGPQVRFRLLKRRQDCTQAKETSAKGWGENKYWGIHGILEKPVGFQKLPKVMVERM